MTITTSRSLAARIASGLLWVLLLGGCGQLPETTAPLAAVGPLEARESRAWLKEPAAVYLRLVEHDEPVLAVMPPGGVTYESLALTVEGGPTFDAFLVLGLDGGLYAKHESSPAYYRVGLYEVKDQLGPHAEVRLSFDRGARLRRVMREPQRPIYRYTLVLATLPAPVTIDDLQRPDRRTEGI